MPRRQKNEFEVDKTPMVRGDKLNLVSIDKITNEHMVVAVRMKKLQVINGQAKNDDVTILASVP